MSAARAAWETAADTHAWAEQKVEEALTWEKRWRILVFRAAMGTSFRRNYGVLGHTHVSDVQYWPDLVGHIIRSRVRFYREGTAYRHESLAWTIRAQREGPPVFLEPVIA